MSWQTNRSTKKTCASRIELSQKMPQRRNYFSVIIIWKAGRLCWAWWSIPTIQQLQSGESRVSSKVRFHLKRLKKNGERGRVGFGKRAWLEKYLSHKHETLSSDPQAQTGKSRELGGNLGSRFQPGGPAVKWAVRSGGNHLTCWAILPAPINS